MTEGSRPYHRPGKAAFFRIALWKYPPDRVATLTDEVVRKQLAA